MKVSLRPCNEKVSQKYLYFRIFPQLTECIAICQIFNAAWDSQHKCVSTVILTYSYCLLFLIMNQEVKELRFPYFPFFKSEPPLHDLLLLSRGRIFSITFSESVMSGGYQGTRHVRMGNKKYTI